MARVVDKIDGNIYFCKCGSVKDSKCIGNPGSTNDKHANHMFLKHPKILIEAIKNQLETNQRTKMKYWDINGFVSLNLCFSDIYSLSCSLCFDCNKIFYNQDVSFAQKHRASGSAKRSLTITDKLTKHSNCGKCDAKSRIQAFKKFVAEHCGWVEVNEFIFGDEAKPKIEKKPKRGRKPVVKETPKATGGAGITVTTNPQTLKDDEENERDIYFYRSYYHLMKAKISSFEKFIERLELSTIDDSENEYRELLKGKGEMIFKTLLKDAIIEKHDNLKSEIINYYDEDDEELNFINVEKLSLEDANLVLGRVPKFDEEDEEDEEEDDDE